MRDQANGRRTNDRPEIKPFMHESKLGGTAILPRHRPNRMGDGVFV